MRDVADVLGIGQHQFEVFFEQMPPRFPVHAGRFRRHMGCVMGRALRAARL
jgi:hypothetical protein